MTIVRIVLADPRTGRPPGGSAVNGRQLIVLADTVAAEDGGHRAVPLWLPGLDFKLLWWLLDAVSAPGTARDAVPAGVLEESRPLSDNGTVVGVKEPRRAVLTPLAVPMSLAAGRQTLVTV